MKPGGRPGQSSPGEETEIKRTPPLRRPRRAGVASPGEKSHLGRDENEQRKEKIPFQSDRADKRRLEEQRGRPGAGSARGSLSHTRAPACTAAPPPEPTADGRDPASPCPPAAARRGTTSRSSARLGRDRDGALARSECGFTLLGRSVYGPPCKVTPPEFTGEKLGAWGTVPARAGTGPVSPHPRGDPHIPQPHLPSPGMLLGCSCPLCSPPVPVQPSPAPLGSEPLPLQPGQDRAPGSAHVAASASGLGLDPRPGWESPSAPRQQPMSAE